MTEQPPAGDQRPAPAPRAGLTTPENPWPLRLLAENLHAYIARCDPTWVEGQIIEINERPRVTFLTLRDVDQEISVPVTLFPREMQALETPLEKGMRVVAQVRPDYWTKTGRLSMIGHGVRPVGLGDLLVRIEQLRRALAEEGLFDAERKRPIPQLPQRVGLITGRNSDAEKDVVRNASLRWPSVQFEIRNVAVQGAASASQVMDALAELDAHPDVDVIIIARGGGAFEDLLPFSDERLLRAVADASTPVISAIGHENDQPLLDHVADVRASTPTDAGKRVVPDLVEEKANVARARAVLDRAVTQFLDRERRALDAVRSRPVLDQPEGMILVREEDIDRLRERAQRTTAHRIDRDRTAIEQMKLRVRALSPQQTLNRGYAVVQDDHGVVVRGTDQVAVDDELTVRLAAGELSVRALELSQRRPGQRRDD
ncbi:exodeoxyribonuclease VII large subunit [Kocuria palustris]|uniref:exodeoxyribonuclease VII large subunit n=1 Tax=Kocuria TaxID=57493 RepID=UPI0006AA1721|nr:MULTISPECIES: exodeoxyribonuclease VII large subunit [Kocuria]ALB02698.1 exodeoxyribonuclease VII large subunit [Kocuria palustris]MCT1835328.1 exodeoxyribonuclease VII large subunit [Kocuria palustris]MCY1682938.1 exodeoxyribonuclease VII large subunit [Kocuria sp. SL71]